MDKKRELLWRDECQPLTNDQMANIKSQFHPSNTANVNIVPYHIYDEDGEEIIVGEVRKTIDGVKKSKPVYEKTIDFGALPNSTTKTVNHNIVNLEAIYYWNMNGTQSNGVSLFIPYVSRSAVKNSCDVYINTTVIECSSGTNLSTYTNCKIVVQYTKTTDEWQPI